MALCAASCSAAVPRYPTGCTFSKRKGGIPNLIFMSCNWKFATAAEGSVQIQTPTGSIITTGVITDPTSWDIGIQNDMIRISPTGLGEKPESTFTTARFSSCLPEEISDETHAINFQSFQIDPDNFYDRAYWNNVRTNFPKFRLIYIDCNDIIYYTGDVSDPGFEFVPTALGYVIPQVGQTDKAYYQANLSWSYEGIPDMISVAGLDFSFDVNT